CDVVDVIEFNQVVVAGKEDCAMRMIAHVVVRDAEADAAQENAGGVTFRPAGLALEMAVLHEMAAGGERLAVAAGERDAAIAGVKNVATGHAVVRAAIDDDAKVAKVAEAAADDAVAGAARDLDAVAARHFKSEALDGDVARVGHFYQRLIQHRQQRLARGQGRGPPEIERAALPIQEPLARLVEFLPR